MAAVLLSFECEISVKKLMTCTGHLLSTKAPFVKIYKKKKLTLHY